jgi:hypothetical protein
MPNENILSIMMHLQDIICCKQTTNLGIRAFLLGCCVKGEVLGGLCEMEI